MKISIITVGCKLDSWVNEGVDKYLYRLGSMRDISVELIEIQAKKRAKSADIARLVAQESEALVKAIPKDAYVMALDLGGKDLSSEQLAKTIGDLHAVGKPLACIIGGAEGFDAQVRARADMRWSLSALTLAHPIARLVTVEALYRAVSILQNHPYHRGERF